MPQLAQHRCHERHEIEMLGPGPLRVRAIHFSRYGDSRIGRKELRSRFPVELDYDRDFLETKTVTPRVRSETCVGEPCARWRSDIVRVGRNVSREDGRVMVATGIPSGFAQSCANG